MSKQKFEPRPEVLNLIDKILENARNLALSNEDGDRIRKNVFIKDTSIMLSGKEIFTFKELNTIKSMAYYLYEMDIISLPLANEMFSYICDLKNNGDLSLEEDILYIPDKPDFS